MAHEFESGMFVGRGAWHRLGTVIEEAPTTKEGIKLAGLDWSANLKDLVTVDQAQSAIDYAVGSENIDKINELTIEPNVKHRAVVRSTDNRVLGVVGPKYTPLQNVDAFSWFDDYIDSGLCKLETAGSLKNGQVVWVLASIGRQDEEILTNDRLKKYFLLSNSHDGTQAVRIGSTMVRVVCANTLASALSNYNKTNSLIRLRHGRNVKQNLDAMKSIIDEADMSFKATAEQYQFLANKQINSKDLRKYVKTLLSVDNVKDEELKTRTKNTLDLILGNMDKKEQQIAGMSGTWYAAYNSYNSWLCHARGRNEENRLHNIWFGTGQTDNNKAFSLATQMAV